MSNWSEREVSIAVEAYLEMLHQELLGRSVNKTEMRRSILPQLDGRSNGSLEFKNCNISAALLDLGCPAIDGYKPRWNYQKSLLPAVVSEKIAARSDLLRDIANFVTATPDETTQDSLLVSEVEAPEMENGYAVSESNAERNSNPKHVNFLDIEARNSALGLRGEEIIFEFERNRLIEAGKQKLADRVEHVSKDRGDGAGFDIRSFGEKGDDLFIEVKTTRLSKYTPFFISENEVDFSKRYRANYSLYRLFDLRSGPKLFTLPGDVGKNCVLTPSVYRGSFGN